MGPKLLIAVATGALLASTPALAQAAPQPEQTSEDLVCQLADSCDATATEEPADDAAIESTPAAPGSRISATRGFSIATRVSPPNSGNATGTSRQQVTPSTGTRPRPGAGIASSQSSSRVIAPGKAKRPIAAMKNAGSGRADLRVSFITGSAELTEYGQREAQKFAEALKSPYLSGMRFRIEGHTDAVGNRGYNLDLSRRRAQAVVDYLSGKGADRGRFDVTGYGFDKPIAGTAPTAAANRRVEVVRIR
ncbi:MAG: OmpA family protein [Novosphingobium sp.]